MALNRWRRRFDGNERIDLPDFRTMMDRAFEDFKFLIKTFVDNQSANRTIRRYVQGTHSANVFRIKKDFNRAILDSTQEWLYVNTDAANTTENLAVLSNTTNYIQVRILFTNDDLQTRAFWDTDIGLTGEEFFDEINVRTRIDEQFQVNQVGFTGGQWIPLFTVVTDSGGAITSVAESDDPLWKPRAMSLPAAASRPNVYKQDVQDLRSFIDFISALMTEVKGTGQALESAPWSSLKLLREYQNVFYTDGGNIEWEGTQGANKLGWSSAIGLDIAGRAANCTIAAAQVTLADGQCMYVDVPETGGGPLTPQVAALSAVPISPLSAGQSPRTLVLFYRKGSKVYGTMDIPEMDSGEVVVIGQDLPNNLRSRLGITSETSFQAYTSTIYIALNDTYPEALSKLDAALGSAVGDTAADIADLQAQIDAITSDLAIEEDFTVGIGGQTVFTLATITMHTSNSVPDVQVRRNGQILKLASDGTSATGDYKKNSATEIEFFETIPENSLVVVRDERTGGGGGGGGGDLTNITVDPQPQVAANKALGTVTKPWKSLFVKDKTTSQVWEIEVDSGVLQATAVP